MEICKDCKYYSEYTNEPNAGRCHRFPPQAVGMTHILYKFPEVQANDWCAEYQWKDAPTMWGEPPA